MALTITGKNIETTDGLKQYIEEKLLRIKRHYQILTVNVTLEVAKARQIAKINVHVAGAELHAEAEESDMYAAIDILMDRLDHQIIKHKEIIQEKRD